MAVRKVNYCYAMVPNRPGHGVKILGRLREEGVNLLAFSGFPGKAGKAQIDLVTDDMAGVRRAARTEGWRLSKPKKGFLVQGKDRVGAVHKELERLAEAGISVTAADAVAAGKKRYGMILWVRPNQYARAARALNAR